MQIGRHIIDPPVILAPMAGITDKPFRLLCKKLGAGLVVSEMTASDPRLWKTEKSRRRMDHDGEPSPVAPSPGGDGATDQTRCTLCRRLHVVAACTGARPFKCRSS